MAPQYQTIDLSFLESFTSGNKERMEKYVQNFLSYAPPKFKELKDSAEKKEWDKVKITAHSLKPQFNYMGIKELIPVFESIEEFSGNQVNLDRVPDIISEAEITFNKGIVELSSFIEND